MADYIITSEQIEDVVRASYHSMSIPHEFQPITRVEIKGERLPEIVRCGDCRYLCDDGSTWGCGWHCSCLCTNDGTPPNGYCSWGVRRDG